MNPTGFRLVTLNTWKGDGAYRQRLGLMASGLQALAADAVALQECFLAADGSADTAARLCDATGLRPQVLRARHKVRAFEGRSVAGWSCQTLLSAHPVRSTHAVSLPCPPGDDDRRVQLVQLDVHGWRVTVANVHLTHLPHAPDAATPSWRARQLQAVRDALVHLGPADLTVIAGDVNEDLSGPGLRGHMTGPAALQDAFALAGQARSPTFFDDQGRGRVLDHVLLVPSLTRATVHVTEARTVLHADRPDAHGTTASDHSGLLVGFTLS